MSSTTDGTCHGLVQQVSCVSVHKATELLVIYTHSLSIKPITNNRLLWWVALLMVHVLGLSSRFHVCQYTRPQSCWSFTHTAFIHHCGRHCANYSWASLSAQPINQTNNMLLWSYSICCAARVCSSCEHIWFTSCGFLYFFLDFLWKFGTGRSEIWPQCVDCFEWDNTEFHRDSFRSFLIKNQKRHNRGFP